LWSIWLLPVEAVLEVVSAVAVVLADTVRL